MFSVRFDTFMFVTDKARVHTRQGNVREFFFFFKDREFCDVSWGK